MNSIVQELKNFSKENWWIYILLLTALVVVYITGKGNMLEIILLFLANILGNLCIMIMQNNYTKMNNSVGAIYHVSATAIFALLGVYGLIYLGQSQYIIWQVTYSLAAFKAFSYYNFKKDLTFLNEYSFIILNIVLFGIFITYFDYQGFSLLQALGFSLITSGLVSIKDTIRYWLNVIGIGALTSGSLWGVILSYQMGNIDGIALGFFVLTLTVFVYYIKLIKKYIPCTN